MTTRETEQRTAGAGDFLAVLARRRLIWIPVFLVVLVISLVTYFMSPVRYASATRILVSRGERESSLNPRVHFLKWEEELASEVETVHSQPVREIAERKLEKAGLRADDGEPITLEHGWISAAPIRGSNVLEIEYRTADADLSVHCVTAITEAYMEYRRATRRTPEISEFFSREIGRVTQTLQDLREEKRRILESAGVANLGEQRLETMKVLSELKVSLVRVREQLTYAQARLEALRSFRSSDLANIDFIPIFVGDELRDDGGLRNFVVKLSELQAKETELASRYTETHPVLIEIREQIEGQRQLITQAADHYEGILNAKLETWRARERHYRREVDKLEWELREFPGYEYDLERVGLEIATLQDDYRRLINESTSAGIQNASAPSWTVRLYAAASEPRRIQSGDIIRTLVVPALALLIAMGLAFAIDGLDPSVKTPSEAEAIFGAPVLATVQNVGKK